MLLQALSAIGDLNGDGALEIAVKRLYCERRRNR